MYFSPLGNWVLKLPWDVPKILYLYGNLRCKDVSWYTKMDMKSQVATFVTFHLINFTFHKIPQILFYRNEMPEKTIQFILTRIFEVSFEGGPLWLVWLFWQVGWKCPFQFDKTVVPSTALLYPADNYCVQYYTNAQWVVLGLYSRNVGDPFGTWNFWILKRNFCWMESTLCVQSFTSPDQSTCKENFTDIQPDHCIP